MIVDDIQLLRQCVPTYATSGEMSRTIDLWDVIEDSERCVVHVADGRQRGLSDIFAGYRPSPGGPFAAVETSVSDRGSVIGTCSTAPTAASCR
jgi:hypothetical protein